MAHASTTATANTLLQPANDGLTLRPSGKWAATKLDYLKRYIDIVGRGMQRKWPQRHYIDLMAGPGKCRERITGEISLGSPLLALTAVVPFTRYFFIESDERSARDLYERCSASPYISRVEVIIGDCNVAVDHVCHSIEKLGKSLNVAFLDPEGLEVHWQTVVRLASVPHMDLIVNYPQGGLSRLMRLSLSSGNTERLDRYFGDSQWQSIFRSFPRGHQARIIDRYREKLGSLGYTEVTGADTLGDQPLMRNSKRAPLYYLLFASKHAKGNEFWHKVTRRDDVGQRTLFD